MWLIVLKYAIGIAIFIIFCYLMVVVGKFVLKKIMFKYSNDDQSYIKRFEERKNRIQPIGDALMFFYKDTHIAYGVECKLEFRGKEVACVYNDTTLILPQEATDGLFALKEVFEAAVFDRIVFHPGRIGFYSQVCWKGCVYTCDGRKPKFYEKQKEVFRFRTIKFGKNWFMLLA